MKLGYLSYLIFKNSKSITVTVNSYTSELIENQKGWYWFFADFNLADFNNYNDEKQTSKGCKIKETYDKNTSIFAQSLLHYSCFYNGHAAKLKNRLQSHFNLTNDTTGSLGLNNYPEIKEQKITLYYFTESCIENSNFLNSEKETIKKLIKNKVSRAAIEHAWRASNGFPVLCKA